MKLTWELRNWGELTRDELYECMTLRIDVFVVEQNCPYSDADGKDYKSMHLFAKDENGKVVAYARLVEPGVSYKECSIGRVATALSVRKSGVGRLLMQKSIQEVEKKYGKVQIRISAQLYLQRFYETLSFVALGEPYPEDDIPHIEMLFTPA